MQEESRERQAPLPARVQKASIDYLARPVSGEDESHHPNPHVVDRVRKCLERYAHPNANPSEAQTALELAGRLMQRHNVTHPEPYIEGAGGRRGGISRVTVTSVFDKTAVTEQWDLQLRAVMGSFFHCKFIRRVKEGVGATIFYGIAENTAAAALAFKTAYNLIERWGLGYAPHDRLSYCYGIVAGLWGLVHRGEEGLDEEYETAGGDGSASSKKRKRAPTDSYQSSISDHFRKCADRIADEVLERLGVEHVPYSDSAKGQDVPKKAARYNNAFVEGREDSRFVAHLLRKR